MGREGKGGEGRGREGKEREVDRFPELKAVECGSRMGAEVTEGEFKEMTFEVKKMATSSRSL